MQLTFADGGDHKNDLFEAIDYSAGFNGAVKTILKAPSVVLAALLCIANMDLPRVGVASEADTVVSVGFGHNDTVGL